MTDDVENAAPGSPAAMEMQDEDILEAMRSIPGYLDITPGDFKEVYRLAWRHAWERLHRTVSAAQVMTTEVVAVFPETPVAEVAAAMGRRGVSGVPVVDQDNRVLGVISEQDFLSRLGINGARNFMGLVAVLLQDARCAPPALNQLLARDLMSAPAVTVSPDTPLHTVAAMLAARGINRVLVTDPDGRLLGLVSWDDVVKATRDWEAP